MTMRNVEFLSGVPMPTAASPARRPVFQRAPRQSRAKLAASVDSVCSQVFLSCWEYPMLLLTILAHNCKLTGDRCKPQNHTQEGADG